MTVKNANSLRKKKKDAERKECISTFFLSIIELVSYKTNLDSLSERTHEEHIHAMTGRRTIGKQSWEGHLYEETTKGL